MRIIGRTLRASNLAERRLFHTFGVDFLKVPRHLNPYAIGRRLGRLARFTIEDEMIREVFDFNRPAFPPVPANPIPHIEPQTWISPRRTSHEEK